MKKVPRVGKKSKLVMGSMRIIAEVQLQKDKHEKTRGKATHIYVAENIFDLYKTVADKDGKICGLILEKHFNLKDFEVGIQ